MTSQIPGTKCPGISEAQVRSWREDGVLCLRKVFSPEWLDILRAGIAEAMARPGPLAKDYAAGKGKFFTDHAMFRRFEPFRRFVFESPAGRIAAQLMGARKVNLLDDHLLVKEPGTENPTYWHQDFPYYEIEGGQFCSLWIPLDPVTAENGAMRFVKGSHRWGKLYHPVRIGKGELVEQAEDLDGAVPDIDAEPDAYPVVSWDLQPGDCMAFDGRMLHSATPNSSATVRRRALSLRFTGDDIRWHPRPYAPTDNVPLDLRPGGPIDCEAFPVVWAA